MMNTVVLVLSAALLLTGIANGSETWAVVTYTQTNGRPLDSQVFYEVSSKDREAAVDRTKAACEMYAKNKGIDRYKCDVVGVCSEPGWFSIASSIRSGGAVRISCRQETGEKAIASAKKACGSPACAALFTYEIKKEEKKKKAKKRQ
jgi:hypothetical protein